jgi:Skp family chaperone for outer membrane proteins
MFVILGALTAVAASYVGSQLSAQQTATQPAPAQTRVAFVNIVTVFQKYQKAMFFKAELEKKLEPFKSEAKKLNEEAEQWRDWVKKNPNLSPADRDKADKAILARKRRLEDINREVQKLVGEKNEQQVIQLYKEVNDAVAGYARANGFQAVLAYGDADPAETDIYTFANISRKVQGMEMGGGVSPMYIAPGMDISNAVVTTLNQHYMANGGGPATVPGTPTSLQK